MSCLQLQAKLIAVIEIVIASLAIIFFGFFAVILNAKRDELLQVIEEHPDEHPHLKMLLEASTLEKLSLFIVPVFYFLTELGLGIFLYQSAQNLNHKRLRLWLMVTATLVAVGVVFFLAEILRIEDSLDITIVFSVNLAFSFYSMWVVLCLIREIKAGGIHHPVPYQRAGFHKL